MQLSTKKEFLKHKLFGLTKTVFWTNVGKIVDLFLKNSSLDLSGTRLG